MRGAIAVVAFLLAASVAAATQSCFTDLECQRTHTGICWVYTGSTRGGVCACAPDQTFRADLGTCEGTVESLVTEVAAPSLLYYADNGTVVDRYGPTPLWPPTWSCDVSRCTASDDAAVASYMVLTSGALSGGTLAPDEVAIHCNGGTRFYESAYAPSQLMLNAAPVHHDNCISCDAWCGAHGTCTNATTFACACDAGWGGRRCEHAVAAPMLSALAPAGALARPVPFVYTANDMFRALMSAAFPAYATGRPCLADGSCDSNEMCYVSVGDATAFGLGASSACFCAPGYVPSGASGCTDADTRPVFGARVNGRNSIGEVTNNFTADGLQLAFLTLPNGARVVSARASDLTPQSRSSARMDPVLIACAAGTDSSIKSPTDPAGWCDACAVGCNGQACTAEAGCVCDEAHTGPQCMGCADVGMIGPACNVSYVGCATERCNGAGTCLDTVCACDASHVGPYCTETPVSCGHLYCNGRGLCANDGTCVCEGGWTGANCTVSAEDCGARLCGSFGSCVGTACACDTNRTGLSCATPLCVGGSPAPDGSCVCDAGHTGTWCEVAPCGGGSNGTRQADGTCACEGVLRGPACESHICGDGYAYDPYTCVCPGGYALVYAAIPQCIAPLRTVVPTATFPRARPSSTERGLVAALVSAAPLVAIALRVCTKREE